MNKPLQVTIRQSIDEPPPPVMRLYLKERTDGVVLRGDDDAGHTWNIAFITPDGLELIKNIPPNTGWPLDEKGRIKVLP